MAKQSNKKLTSSFLTFNGNPEQSAKTLNQFSRNSFTEFKSNFKTEVQTARPLQQLITKSIKGNESAILKEYANIRKSKSNQPVPLRKGGGGNVPNLGNDDGDPRKGTKVDPANFISGLPYIPFSQGNVYYPDGQGDYTLIPKNGYPDPVNGAFWIESTVTKKGIVSADQALGGTYMSNDKGFTVVRSGISAFVNPDILVLSGVSSVVVTARILIVELTAAGENVIAWEKKSYVISFNGTVLYNVFSIPIRLEVETNFKRKPSVIYNFWNVISVTNALDATDGYSTIRVDSFVPGFLGFSGELYT